MTEHAVKLASLPSDFELPPEVAKRIRFDPATHQLIFRGFMSKADYDRLMRLKGSVDYGRAIEHLFQISTEDETPGSRRLRRVLATLVAVCLVLAAVVWWQLVKPAHEPGSETHTPAVSAAESNLLSPSFTP
jgi:hypothetical protein